MYENGIFATYLILLKINEDDRKIPKRKRGTKQGSGIEEENEKRSKGTT